jgi:hypothetical protein
MGSECDQIKKVIFGGEILAKNFFFCFWIFSQKKIKN